MTALKFANRTSVLSSRSLGDWSDGGTPGYIPNPVVKPVSADGTAIERSWESRPPPAFHEKPAPICRGGLRFLPLERAPDRVWREPKHLIPRATANAAVDVASYSSPARGVGHVSLALWDARARL